MTKTYNRMLLKSRINFVELDFPSNKLAKYSVPIKKFTFDFLIGLSNKIELH